MKTLVYFRKNPLRITVSIINGCIAIKASCGHHKATFYYFKELNEELLYQKVTKTMYLDNITELSSQSIQHLCAGAIATCESIASEY